VNFRPTFFWGSRSESLHNMHKLLSYHLHMKVVAAAWVWVVAIAKQVCVRVKVCQLLTVYTWICFPGLTTLIFGVRMCRFRVKIWTKFMCTRIEKCYPVYIAHFYGKREVSSDFRLHFRLRTSHFDLSLSVKRRLLHAIDKKNLMKNIYTIRKKNVLWQKFN
jgi:hypothetical protein